MKVAICFSGMPMFIKQHEKCWLELIDKYQADVYASLWSEENTYREGDTIEYFERTYNPTSIEVEDPQALYKSFRFLGEEFAAYPVVHQKFAPEANRNDHLAMITGRSYLTYYKIWRANQLCVAAKKEYDVVVRAETCSSYPHMEIIQDKSISMPLFFPFHTMSGSVESKPISYKQLGLWQHVAFGPPDLMIYFSSLIFYYRKYLDECIQCPGEAVFNYHLSRRPDIPIRLFPIAIERKDDGGSGPKNPFVGDTNILGNDEIRCFSGDLSAGVFSSLVSWGDNSSTMLNSSLKELDLSEIFSHKMHSNIPFKGTSPSPKKDSALCNFGNKRRKDKHT